MKEFIDKLIERLEENTIQHKESITLFNECGVKFIAVGKVKEIVNELAEQYKVSEMPTGWKENIIERFERVE